MSNWNPQDLRKWKPRRPSPELRARIFRNAPEQAATVAFDLRDLSRWIVPALGCFLLVMATLSSHLQPRHTFQLATTNFFLAPFSDDQSAAILPHSGAHSGVNAVPARKLEWNFGARLSVNSMSSIVVSYTNKLIQ